jgi:hypothetical protein
MHLVGWLVTAGLGREVKFWFKYLCSDSADSKSAVSDELMSDDQSTVGLF